MNLASLQGTSSLQDAVRMQQGLPWKHGTHSDVQQLTRITLSTEDSSSAAQAFSGTHAAANSYHLLAVQPMSERVLQQVCCVVKHFYQLTCNAKSAAAAVLSLILQCESITTDAHLKFHSLENQRRQAWSMYMLNAG